MEELINEAGIIPMDLKWRAGIGKEVPDTYSKPSNISNPQPVMNKGEFYYSLLGETINIINGLIQSYLNRDISDTDLIILKSSLRNKIVERFGGYRKYIGLDFFNYLRNGINEKNDLYNILDINYIISCFSEIASPDRVKFSNDIMINE